MRNMIHKNLDDARSEELSDLLRERLDAEQANRMRLKDFVAQLREPGDPYPLTPARRSDPSFAVGPLPNFPYPLEKGAVSPERGHLSPEADKVVSQELKLAANQPTPAGRDAATGRAARAVANDWGRSQGFAPDAVKASLLHEARAQASFAIREVAQRLGLNPAAAQVVGYSFERALEREGFKVMANHAIDKAGDLFKPSSSSTSVAAGMRNSMETKLNQSLQWMADRGVTREALKGFVEKHTGKFQAVAILATNPEVGQRAAQILAHSDSAARGVMALATDREMRQAVGGLTMAAGEAVGTVNRGAGSVAILAGAALKGESVEDTARHAFRAGMAVLGGAAGAVAGGGILSVGTAVVGGYIGSAVAERILSVYDRIRGRAPETQSTANIDRDAVARDAQVVGSRIGERGARAIEERMNGMERSFSMPTAR